MVGVSYRSDTLVWLHMTGGRDHDDARKLKRAFIALLEPDNCVSDSENDVLIGNRVSQAAIKRSVLLSGIENTQGHASLPSQLSPEEVQLWETACATEFEIPLDELVTVLKVADALGDRKLSDWAEKLATRVKATEWHDGQKADAMLGALLRLPLQLLPSVLSKCGSLDDMLSTFPPPLHLAAVCACAQHSMRPGAVVVQHSNAAAALHAVASAPSPATTIQSMHFLPGRGGEVPAAAGALLARAACSLPSLATLQICCTPLPRQWLHNFASCLEPGSLPSLIELDLCTEGCPATCADLLRCLPHLPALTALLIAFQLAGAPAGAEVSLHSFTRLAAGPVHLPSLKFLFFEEGLQQHGCAASRIDRPSCASSFLPLTSAPSVTRLHLDSLAASSPLRDLVAAVSRYPGLQDLFIQATLRGEDVSRAVCQHDGPFAAVPPLTEVRTRSSCPVSTVALAARIASGAQQSLTSLQVCLEEGPDMFSDAGCTPEVLTSVWRKLSFGLRSLAGLKHLKLDCICGIPPDDVGQAAFSQNLAVGLACLTQLTFLLLGATAERLTPDGTSVLIGSHLGGAIGALTSLESLALTDSDCDSDANIEVDSVQPLFDACVRLEKLKALRLDCEGVQLRQVSTFLAEQRALTSLTLGQYFGRSEIEDAAEREWKEQYPHIKISVYA